MCDRKRWVLVVEAESLSFMTPCTRAKRSDAALESRRSALAAGTFGPPLHGVKSVSVGGSHSCAVMAADGTVRCWGYTSGELGNGTHVGSAYPSLSTKGMATGTWSIRPDLGDGVEHSIVISVG